MNKVELNIVNIYNHKKYIPQVSDWIFSEFIENKIKNCSHLDIVTALESRPEKSIPMTYIGLLGSQCVGTISIFVNDLKSQPELSPWLAALYVSPNYRKLGYAKNLIKKIEEVSSKMDCQKLYLRTETAGEYYLKLGWIKRLVTVDENELNTTVFEKHLKEF